MSSDIDVLYDELSELHETPKEQRQFTQQEERVIAGFAEISRFYEEHKCRPQHGAERDIFERLYAVRLDRIRAEPRYCELLTEHGFDKYGLLTGAQETILPEDLSDDALLAELGADEAEAEDSITRLVHVRPHNEQNPRDVPEEKAVRRPCLNFMQFEPLFAEVKAELQNGARVAKRFEAQLIEAGNFFILGGQMLYVAEKGKQLETKDSREQAQLRVIFDNGMESNMLLHSVRTALYRDKTGRSISEPSAAALPLFGGEAEEGDRVNGIIYVLESCSPLPEIAAQKGLLHKIGVTGGEVKKRLINAKKDPTFLMAEVRIVREYELVNIHPVKLENMIHRFFSPAQARITIRDRFGEPITPKEWFFAPLPAIDEAVARIKDGTLPDYRYDAATARLVKA